MAPKPPTHSDGLVDLRTFSLGYTVMPSVDFTAVVSGVRVLSGAGKAIADRARNELLEAGLKAGPALQAALELTPGTRSGPTRKGHRKLLDRGMNRFSASVDGTEFVLVGNEYAHAVAVEAAPTADAAQIAIKGIRILREHHFLDEFGTLGVAFQGPTRPSREAVSVLRDAEVYVVTDNLKSSAEQNAWAFLADVEQRMPAVKAIVSGGPR